MNRIIVRNCHILEDEGGEWLEMDLLESDVSVNLFGYYAYDLFRNHCLHLRRLDRESQSECKSCDSD